MMSTAQVVPNPVPDLKVAERYLTLLDEAADQFTFQTFDDLKSRKDPSLIKVLNGTLEQHATDMTRLQWRRAGVFVTVNETDGAGRKNDNIKRIRAVWCEWDNPEPLPNFPLEPHLIVESSPKKYHIYWRVEGLMPPEFDGVMQTMVSVYGSDPNAKDRARVLRLPGFWHQKGEQFQVRIVEESGAIPYGRNEILQAFPPTSRPRSRSAQPVSSQTIPPDEVARIRAALAYISSDDRDEWVAVGMALHSTGAGQQAYGLWCEWAQQSPKFDSADSARVWESLQPTGTGIGAIFSRAKANGWTPHRADRVDEPAAINETDAWKSDLISRIDRKTGEVSYPCRAHNLILIIENSEEWKGRIQFDEFRKAAVDRGREWKFPEDTIELKAWFEKTWISGEVKTATVNEAIAAVAARHKAHPIRDWLEGLEWDRIERLPTFFSDFCGAKQTPYTDAVGRSLFVSAVARIMRPGCQVDTMVTLEGEQGIGKSRLVRALFGEDWRCEITEAPGVLDFYQCMRGKWVGEFSELSAMGRADQNRVKQALTSTYDTYRNSYGHVAQTHPRQFIFIGNTNKEEYLFDETGARRYLPIECREIDSEAVGAIRDQLFAEAMFRFGAGEKWHDIPGAAEEQEKRYQVDSWQDHVGKYLENRGRVTMTEIMEEALFLKIEKQDRGAQTRVGAILRRMGWRVVRENSGNRNRYYEKIQ